MVLNMVKQTDLRVVRTRKMIKEAFVELMDSVGFSKITIDSLAKKAFINRNTFYLHYTDKFDLLEQLQNEILDGLKEIVKDIPIELMKERGMYNEKSIVIIHQVYCYIEANSRFFLLMMREDGDHSFILKFTNTIKNVILEKIAAVGIKPPPRYIFAIMTGVFTGIIGEWLNSGMRESPDELADMMILYLGDVPKKILKES